ncbi:thymidylate synthase [Halogranum tailed virus 1]|uniref:Thymidylate synthase n=1 Tax=Halogranum tailed virus 1 TaxID=1273749 RepID=R4T950_9CAUD|nr:thymidylate synthase [Halogranum tailed virus 1]AGM11415.1 thymidylate synthase [Halogranum tailed virus 1]
MKVEVLNKTENPERLICRSGRGDMYGGFVGDADYTELMEPVDYGTEDIAGAIRENPQIDNAFLDEDIDELPDYIYDEAKTRAFIRKQASRGHWGIWEHPSITFAIEGMSRVTMAQITRHRHLSFDIQSMRYVDFDDPDYAMPESLTNPDHFTRSDGLVWEDEDDEVRENAKHVYEKALKNCTIAYESLLDLGVPAEDARYALPLATQVNVTMSGNARTMLHVLNLRQRGNAQWEIRNMSDGVVEELREWIPYTAAYWDDKGPVQISP